ncbi:hypothetical protein [Chryseobacterium potabilaquae]|uniref:Uncharacterized protein n=1 Tax=Chryseobacterium potabilaquae TaxID=2675057 RepID=A0A6N4X560_9FLAO|nr:hypothetical protein [Chryseobacterium potabilaquae]CAA7194637.1 hypothetical protein CHRY9293_00924 [Chryseobacterium potabilaquae]
MKKLFYFALSISTTFCFAQKEFQPAGSEVIESIEGDLDNDHIPEKVIVYNTKDSTEQGSIREIQILKNRNGKWTILEKSQNAILESNAGGMMGDPYGSIRVEKGILNISQSGGSSWKWGYTDKYRFQNGHFELIGYSSAYGKPEEYFDSVDFNLSTGRLDYEKEVENTQQYGPSKKETYFKKGLKINLQNRNQPEQRKITLPKTKEEIYF